jgi:ABC-type Zn uptake system ZnuABC Zn-binding protein ZnuA
MKSIFSFNKEGCIVRHLLLIFLILIAALLVAACQPAAAPSSQESQSGPPVLATAPFLADITQNIAGDRAQVDTLVPLGVDPHAFDPTPRDIAKIAGSEVLVVNGGGLESFLDDLLENAPRDAVIIEASSGLNTRSPAADEPGHDDGHPDDQDDEHEDDHLSDEHEGDPHFWLDPNLVIRYAANIRDGLIQADPEGREVYTRNSEEYIARLVELDGWIREQVDRVPPDSRLMVTNHESFGYFADRYGFRIIGTVIPSFSTGTSPSAQDMARLVEVIKETGALAIFLETSANPRLAEQIASETGVVIPSGLYSHSLSDRSGPASNYIDMMKYNTLIIVEALAP